MTSRAQIEDTIRSLWAARVRGDLEGTLKDVAENAAFSVNARGTGETSLSGRTTGKAAIRPVLRQLIENWRFDDWKQTSLLIDGEKALLHWTARVSFVPTGKSENFDVFDLITFQDDKIVDYHQSTDTALMMSLAA
jgi:ketosteroid isomerase-like protein